MYRPFLIKQHEGATTCRILSFNLGTVIFNLQLIIIHLQQHEGCVAV